MKFYVYKITNTKNDKVYVGQTTETLNRRFKRHINKAQLDNPLTKIHRAINKYGSDIFSISLLEECTSQEQLTEREYFWINYLDSVNNGYNINDTQAKCGGDTLQNHPKIKEIGLKISKSVMGGNNHRAVKVKAIDVTENKEYIFEQLMDCVRDLELKTHKNITRITMGGKKSPYKGRWLFEYI